MLPQYLLTQFIGGHNRLPDCGCRDQWKVHAWIPDPYSFSVIHTGVTTKKTSKISSLLKMPNGIYNKTYSFSQIDNAVCRGHSESAFLRYQSNYAYIGLVISKVIQLVLTGNGP